MFRLLPKSEAARRIQEEKQQQENEGMRIAEHVDILRETAMSEEIALEKYRLQRLNDIQEEIAEREKYRDALIEEITNLEIKRGRKH